MAGESQDCSSSHAQEPELMFPSNGIHWLICFLLWQTHQTQSVQMTFSFPAGQPKSQIVSLNRQCLYKYAHAHALWHTCWFEPSCRLMITGVPTDDLRLPAEHLLHRRQRILRAILLLWHARWVGSVKPIKIFVFLSCSVVVNEAWIWCFFYCAVSVWVAICSLELPSIRHPRHPFWRRSV